jgi:hypothetical protein
MPDFFSRLIARSNGDIPAARPVIAPMFAQAPAVAEEQGDVAPEIREAEMPEFLPDKSRVHVSHAPANLLPPRSSDTPQFQRTSEELPANRFVKLVAPSNLIVSAEAPERNAPGSLRSNPDSQTELPFRDRAPQLQDPANPAQLSKGEESREVHGDVWVAADYREPEETHLPPAAFQPRITQQDSARRERIENTNPESQGTRSIRVTIGRVDVRAILPAKESATRTKNTRPTSPLSLEDYLKQRKAGQR